MKKVCLLLLSITLVSSAFAQNTKALRVYGYNAQIGDFDPSNATFSSAQTSGMVQTIPRDFIFDAKNSRVIYQDKSNGLVIGSLVGGQFSSKNFTLTNTVMAPAYIPASEEIVCFNVQKEFNGYGNNEDNLFLSKMNIKKGTTSNLMKMSDLSFDKVVAPFYGKTQVLDRFTGKIVEKDVAMSKPIYIASKDLYMVLIRDVTGTNRLFKMHVNAPQANVSSARCEFNIIDMTMVEGTNIAKTLFFDKLNSDVTLKIGDFDINTMSMTNVVTLESFNAAEINNGSIKFNGDNTQLYASYYNGMSTHVYNLDLNSNQNNGMVSNEGFIQFDYGFSEEDYKPLQYSDFFGLYPNPSTGHVFFKNNSGVIPNNIKVYDNLGQMVRSIKIDELESHAISIDLSNMTPGIYHVRVDMPGQDFIGKVALTH